MDGKKNRIIISVCFLVILFSLVMDAQAAILFREQFNRNDSSTIGNGWVKTISSANADCEIKDNQLKCIDNDAGNRVLLTRYVNTSDEMTVFYRIKTRTDHDYYAFGVKESTSTPDLAGWNDVHWTTMLDLDGANSLIMHNKLNTAWVTLSSGTTNSTWYHINVTSDNTANKVTFKYSGTSSTQDHGQGGDVESLSYLFFFSSAGANKGSILIDDICIVTEPSTYEDCFPATPTPTLTLNTNMVSGLNLSLEDMPFKFGFNGTISDVTNYSFDCTLKANGTLINSTKVNDIRTTSYIHNSISDTGAGYVLRADCSNNEVSAFKEIELYIDTNLPQIEVTGIINNGIYFKDELLSGKVKFTDNNLYAYNISLKNINNEVILRLNETGLNTNSKEVDVEYTFTNSGNYTYFIEVWDSHTTTAIQDYKIIENEKEFSLDGVKISSSTLLDYELVKKVDRYSFDMQFEEVNPVISLECEDLRFLEDSKYFLHFVCWKEKKWIDFENYKVQKYDMKRINDNKVEITLLTEQKVFTFNSIGDLNYNSELIEIRIINEQTYYLSEINNTLKDIEEGISMLWFVFLYIGIMWFGMTALKNNVVLGLGIMTISLGFDFYLVQKLWTDYALPGMQQEGFTGDMVFIFAVFLGLWIFVKIGFLMFSRFTEYKKRISKA